AEHGAATGGPVLVETEVGVDSTPAVEKPRKFAIGVDQANAILFSEIVADPTHGEVGALSCERTEVGDHQTGRAVVSKEKTKVPRALLSRETGAEGRVRDPSCKQQLREAIHSNIHAPR